MQVVLKSIEEWFTDKPEHFRAFAQVDARLEGWFKGEMIVLFYRLQANGVLRHFDREWKVITPQGRLQVDFRIGLPDGADHLVELKALCISQAAGTPRNLEFYFRDDHVGVVKDLRKLGTFPGGNKWALGFVYPNPGAQMGSRKSSPDPGANVLALHNDTSGLPRLLLPRGVAVGRCRLLMPVHALGKGDLGLRALRGERGSGELLSDLPPPSAGHVRSASAAFRLSYLLSVGA